MPLIRVEPLDFEGLDDYGPSEDEVALDERYLALVVPGIRTDISTSFHSATDHGLPSQVTVGDRAYEVRVFSPGDANDGWRGILGHIDYDDGRVSIRADRPQDERRETLLHEVLHAVDWGAGTQAGEAVVNAWAPVLLDALRRNAELTALLLAEDQT